MCRKYLLEGIFMNYNLHLKVSLLNTKSEVFFT